MPHPHIPPHMVELIHVVITQSTLADTDDTALSHTSPYGYLGNPTQVLNERAR